MSGGANGIRGWRLRELGPGNLNPSDANLVVEGLGTFKPWLRLNGALIGTRLGTWPGSSTPETCGCMGTTHRRRRRWRETGWGSVAAGSGLGVRYDFEVVVLRMDAGLRVHDPVQGRRSTVVGSTTMARRVASWGGNAVLIAIHDAVVNSVNN